MTVRLYWIWDPLVKEIEEGKSQPYVSLDLYHKIEGYKIIPKNMVAYAVVGVLEAGSETVRSLNSFLTLDPVIPQ